LKNSLFIEPKTLKSKSVKSNVKILDATFFLPDSGLNAEEEYKKKHIPNSVFFDINKIADPKNPLPHMIPSKELFSIMMQNLGINNQDEIIIYDNSPLLSSARAWFLFRYFGHENIFILNGGLKNWEKSGGEITNKKTIITKGDFQSKTEKKNLVVDLKQMISVSNNNSKLILDARSYKRFTGEAKEPRPGLLSGHIPNSKNLPSSDLVTNDGFLKSIEELNKIFSNNNFNNTEQIIATCGSGVSACVISVALYCLGRKDVPIYDGSWTEWASSGQKIQTSN
jgi:thiosulfate/3-mercaptopyruvate sulfurtransferase